MKKEFKILKLTSADLSLAQELLQVWNEGEGLFNQKIPSNKYLLKLLSKENFHVYVALVEGKVVSGVTAHEVPLFDKEENEIFLYEIGTITAYRNKGIGAALINALKEMCRKQKISVIFLGTEIENHAAKQLYQKTGAAMETISWFTYELDKEKR